MVERAVGPLHGVVAAFTSSGEAGVRHWSGRVIVVVLVTTYAGCGGDVVVVVDVAIGTLPRRDRVGSGQRKSCAVVIEGGIQPRARVVALLAGLRKVRCDVIRIGRALEIGEVAGYARRAGDVVIAEFRVVTIRALPRGHGMQAGQREPSG